ncbi:DNA-processing protein DprA [Streptomyces sp. NPDC047999]|uniref:DNA-processing protein DprA n=2 Tax=unclassified Streptomyces TaxID=2593676 RepID=UPI00371F65C3
MTYEERAARGRPPETATGIRPLGEPARGRPPGESAAVRPREPGAPSRAPEAEEERAARSALTEILEPGDPLAGRWLRELGAVPLLERLLGGCTGPPRSTVPASSRGRRAGAPAPSPPPREGDLPGLTAARAAGLRTRAAGVVPGRRLARIRELGGRFLVPGDHEWPSQLDDLGDARPVGLWVRGLPDLRRWALRSVAVVGARGCTPYGAHTAGSLAAGLAERGWVVVSGAAFGVDGAAHRGALAAGGATVAVLACGVDAAYPRGHTELIGRIVRQGVVVGELPPGEHPTPSRFLLRNRVIAALTRGTVVVEAARRSGALVTARAAQRLGRFTMGVPGPVTSGLSAGVHELLRGEAVLVSDAAEVIELVGDMGELAPEHSGPVLPRDLLDPATRRVLEALPGKGAASLRAVARAAAVPEDEALGRLYELHALGFAERSAGAWRLAHDASGAGNLRRGGA